MFDALARAIATASGTEFWSAVGVSTGVTAFALWHAYRLFAHKRLIEDMPTTRLRAAAQGYVELIGTALLFDGDQIVAPLTGRTCCWYRFRVEHRDTRNGHHGRDHARWQRVEGGESTGIFMLDDGTGRCAVDPDGAQVTPSARHVWYGKSRIPPRLSAQHSWLAALFKDHFGSGYRYTEEVIEIGSPLYGLGFFRTHGGAAAPADTSGDASALLREWKADRAALLGRYDANRDGEIDTAEWEHARRDAHAEVARTRSHAAGAPLAVDMLSQPEGGEQPYLLAARTEQELAGRHALSGTLWMCAGVVCAVGLACAVVARLGSGT